MLLTNLPSTASAAVTPDFVFTTDGRTALSGYSRAKRAIDARAVEQARAALPAWTIHDLRRMFASGCARFGVNLPVIERALNYLSGSFRGIDGVYQRHGFEQERRAAFELWAAHVIETLGSAVLAKSHSSAGGQF